MATIELVPPLQLQVGDQFEHDNLLLQVDTLHLALHSKVKVYYTAICDGPPTKGFLVFNMDETVPRLARLAEPADQQQATDAANWRALIGSSNMTLLGVSPIELVITNRRTAQAVLRFLAERENNDNNKQSA